MIVTTVVHYKRDPTITKLWEGKPIFRYIRVLLLTNLIIFEKLIEMTRELMRQSTSRLSQVDVIIVPSGSIY